MAGFPLMAIGAGIGQGAEAIQRQRQMALEAALRQLQIKQYQDEQQAASSLFPAALSGAFDAPQMSPLGTGGLGIPSGGGMPDFSGGAGMTMPGATMGGGQSLPNFTRPPARSGFSSGLQKQTDLRAPVGSPENERITDLIIQDESGGRNIKQQVVPPGGGYNPSVGRVTGPSSAQGIGQFIDPTWREASAAIGEGGKYAHAMDAPLDVQRKAISQRVADKGVGDWAPYNSTLARHLGIAPSRDPVQQEADGTTIRAAGMIPQEVYGRMSVRAMAQAIEKANPGADPYVKMLALERGMKLVSPYEKRAWEFFKLQHQDALQAARQAELDKRQQLQFGQQEKMADRRAETVGAKVFVDPEGNEHFVTPSQKVPAGWKLQGTGGTTASKGREQDIEQEVKRLDTEWAGKNPEATDAQKQEAHFQHRQQAEQKLSTATTHVRSPAALYLQKYTQTHPDATDEDIKKAAGEYRFSQAAATAFGGSSRIAQNIISLNTVADHILRTKQYAEALGNGDIPRANQIANGVAKELGRPEVTSFEAGRDIMADEIVRLLTSTGGTEADRQGMQSRLATMFAPAQFAGVFNVFKEFTGARFGALRQQYAQGDKKREQEFAERFLTPEGRQVFDSLSSPTAAPLAPTTPQSPAAAPAATAGKGVGPEPGSLVDGYIFKGGDPADQKNWVPAPAGAVKTGP